MNNTITDVPGIRVGHAHDTGAITGCTVVLCTEGAVGGVDQRGGAPGTRETDLLRPMHQVTEVHAVMLAGGSAFGLAAADGVMAWLEENDIGYPTPAGRVPIVPSAILYDLSIGAADVRPDAAMGRAACEAAISGPIEQGSVGAGMGATVGGVFGPPFAMKGGIGSASIALGDELVIGALVAVNAVGDVVDTTGATIAGARQPPEGTTFANTMDALAGMASGDLQPPAPNTVIGVIATNAVLTKEGANKVAQMAHNGLARTIRPAHTMMDGDTLFALSTGEVQADVNIVGAFAAEVTAQAIINGVRQAQSMGGVPSMSDVG